MKKAVVLFLALLLCLSAAGCGLFAPEPTPTPTASVEPTPTPPPTGTEFWKQNTLRRYNMEYEDFGEYWSLMCDAYFGNAVQRMLKVISFADKEAEIEEKRDEFFGKYGKDARYEIVSAKETELAEKYCTDFEKELAGLYEKARLFLTECEAWDEGAWSDFAERHGCSTEQAKELAAAYADIAEACRDKQIEKALSLEMTLKFSGGGKRTETVNLYVIDGYYVSEQLIDVTDMLLNLVYG